MKTAEELNALKEEVETMSKQLHEMNDELNAETKVEMDELQVSGIPH